MSGPRAAAGVGPILWCLLSAALFGASTPAAKALLGSLSPLLLSGILYAGAALAVAPRALRGLPGRGAVDRQNLARLLGAVVFGGLVGPVLLLLGLSVASAGSVSLWLTLETAATAALARWLFREDVGGRTWIAVALIIAASLLLSGGAPGGGVAVVWVALACLAWGLDNNLTATIDAFTPAQITLAKGVTAGTINTLLGLWVGDVGAPSVPVVAAGLGVGMLGYGASLLFYVAGAQQLGATRSQLLFSTAPAWGLALAWVALGEDVQPIQLGAAGLMAGATWLWTHEHHTHQHTHDALTHRHWHRHDDGHHEHVHDEPVAAGTWHSHAHTHEPQNHAHPHRPDLHHRHAHL